MEVKGIAPRHALERKSLIWITGKGGVGKSTVAAAAAIAAERLGRRVVLLGIRSQGRMPLLFGKPAGNGPVMLTPSIEWRNLLPETSLETYGLLKLRFRMVYRAVFEHRLVKRFLRVVPALAELLMLGHVAHLVENAPEVLHIVDAPSAGHGWQMLQAPRQVLESVAAGPLRQVASWMQEIMADGTRSSIWLVLVPEELPVNEALEFHERLSRQLGLPVEALVANRVLAEPAPQAVFGCLSALEEDAELGPLARTAARCEQRIRMQQGYLDRLRAGLDLTLFELPEMPSRNVKDRLDELSKMMEGRAPA
ncbi:MAG: chromosome partitioning protein [Deltaproteobacteria bacterium]|nr:MAG: chromosome partitioning protein [Deltaproteobacteria bacterium]